MALYVITEVRWDDNRGEIDRVRWARADGPRNEFIEDQHEVGVDRVVEAFDHDDVVVLRFRTPAGWVAGTQLRRKVLAGGHENIEEEEIEDGRTLRDLPIF
jgi:hypothetical protein